ncbi:MAG: hypothetical protein ABII82_20560 [Verrucomicrobiota bacterium]
MSKLKLIPSRLVLSVLSLTLLAPLPAMAAEFYLANDQTGDQHWNRTGPNDRFWREGQGAGAFANRMEPDATYHTDGRILRTRDILEGIDTFAGGTLLLDGGALQVKAGLGGVVKLDRLVASDGSVEASSGLPGGQPQSLQIDRLEQSGTLVFRAKAKRGFKLKIGTLSGDGVIRFEGEHDSSTFQVDVGDASGFTGSFVTDGGVLYVITADGARPIPVLGHTDL